jgi:membrane protease YdiL (CAAX protease family)
METKAIYKPESLKYPVIEIIGALLTAVGKFVFMDGFGVLLPYILPVITFWVAYIFFRVRNHENALDEWGFRRTNLKETFIVVFVFAVFSIGGLIIFGTYTGVILWSWGMMPLMFLYPFWGLIQHFLILGLFTGNLQRLKSKWFPDWLLVILTAIIFGGIHYSNVLLMTGTFILAFFYAIVYLKYRNLWPLGLFHGVLGAMFYYFALGQDQFSRTFPFL